jgi:hypothetical protein
VRQVFVGVVDVLCDFQVAFAAARARVVEGVAEALEKNGLTLDQCRAWVEANPDSKKPLYHVPHTKGVVGVAANFVYHIKSQMDAAKVN